MARRGRKRRILKWVGLVLLAGEVILFVHSAFRASRLNLFVRDIVALQVTSTWGGVDWAFNWPASSVSSGISIDWWDNKGSSLLRDRGWRYVAEAVLRWPGIETLSPIGGQQGVTIIGVPHWMFVLLFALPAIWLWWIDRKRFPPGCCQKCGYDLTGNVSGVCPECGHGVKGQAAA